DRPRTETATELPKFPGILRQRLLVDVMDRAEQLADVRDDPALRHRENSDLVVVPLYEPGRFEPRHDEQRNVASPYEGHSQQSVQVGGRTVRQVRQRGVHAERVLPAVAPGLDVANIQGVSVWVVDEQVVHERLPSK